MEEGTRIFLLAENRLLREALARILKKRVEIELSGTLPFGLDVIPRIASSKARVVVMDSVTVNQASLGFVRQLREQIPGVRVVLIGMEEDSRLFLESVRAGAVGYVFKDASAADVVNAVRAVARGEAVCPPRMTLTLFQFAARQAEYPNVLTEVRFGLTRRQQQLIPMIGRGLTNKEIAVELNLSEQTIKNHIHRMMRRVGVGDRLAIVDLCSTTLLPD